MTGTVQIVDDRGVTVTAKAGPLPELPGVTPAPQMRAGQYGPSFSDPAAERVLGEVRRCPNGNRWGVPGLLVVRHTVASNYLPWHVVGDDPLYTHCHGWRHSEAVAGWERLGTLDDLARTAVKPPISAASAPPPTTPVQGVLL